MKVIPPLWRLADLRGEHDLIEEVGRLHGYDALPPAMPHLEIAPPHRDFRLHALRDALKEERYVEVVPLSLVSPQLLARAALQPTDAVTITNPLGEETSLLHASTVPGLLEHAGRNLPLTGKTLQTFECAHVFSKRKGEWFECGLLIADRTDTPLKETPFLRLKSHIEAALRAGGWPVTTRAAGNVPPFGHPGRGADPFVNETRIGSLTEVHPSVRANFDLPARAAVATLDLTTLLALPAKAAVIASLPQFPAVTYDVTVTRTQGQNTRSLLTELRKASPLLESVEIADLFSDKPLDSHEYKLTLRFTYRAPDRTLTEDEAKREQEKAEKMLASA